MEENWKVYIVRCADGTLYTGIAADLEKRLQQHNSGKGAKYTRGRGPVTLEYTEELGTRGVASRREWEIKAMTREQKLALIRSKQ